MLVARRKYHIYYSVKRDGFVVQTKSARFTDIVALLAQKAVVGLPAPAYRRAKKATLTG
jgi:hypothetical protein